MTIKQKIEIAINKFAHMIPELSSATTDEAMNDIANLLSDSFKEYSAIYEALSLRYNA